MSKSIYARIKQAKQDSHDHKWRQGISCEFYGIQFSPVKNAPAGTYQVTPKFLDYGYVRVMDRKETGNFYSYTLKVCSKDGSPIRDFPVPRCYAIKVLLEKAAQSMARVEGRRDV